MTAVPGNRIHTPDQRLRVFVSSTIDELEQERSAVRRAIETLRLTPVMFELGARPYAPRALYRAYLEQSHVFLAIYWQSYGWVAPEEEVSGIEDEYRLSGDRPRLVYVRRPAAERQERLDVLLNRIRSDDQASYRHFSSADELERLVQDDLMVLLTERFEAAELPTTSPRHAMSEPPVPLTPTVGREDDVGQVQRLLADGCRLLTLVGPGGVGKSRLALVAARLLAPEFPDGVAFVPLEAVDDPADVMRVLAEHVGATVEGAEPPLEVVARHLGRKRVLLLVDNVEQVVAAGSELSALLDACPGVSMLVTSRRPLRLRGEQQLIVEPLPRSPALELFAEQARRVRPSFTLDGSTTEAVAELVRRLDGLPLAIELAAARTNVLEPAQMLERFERGDPVSMSAGQDVPARQRTLRATLEWSCSLLTPSQQTLLERLSVFADGATLESIERVCAGAPVVDLLDDLSALLDTGLLRTDRQHVEGPPRFVLLMTVRELAAERLAAGQEADAVTARFLAWAVETASLGDPVAHRDAPDQWRRLRIETRNLRLAAQLLVEAGNYADFTRLAWGVFHWVFRYGDFSPFARLAERALAESGEPETAEDHQMTARLRSGVAWARFLLGDVAGVLEVIDVLDVDEVAESDPACGALLLNARSLALPLTDGGTQARAAAERALALATSSGFMAVGAYCHSFLANLDLVAGDLESAEQHCDACVAMATEIGLDTAIGQQLGTLGLIALARGRVDEARDRLVASFEALLTDRSQLDAALLLGHVAVLATAEGEPEKAAWLRAVADAAMTRLGLSDWPAMQAAQRAVEGESVPDESATTTAELREADPWDVLATALDRPLD